MTATRNSEKGFTLVELAICLTIIGLLIAAVLRGQEMLEHAKLQKVIKQVQAYTAATYTFLDAYGGLPGDIPTASKRLPGCETGNANNCRDGNGNGTIGDMTYVQDPVYAVETENFQYWKHLALADLITGINVTASAPLWAYSNPVSALSNGFSIISVRPYFSEVITRGMHVLRLHNCLTCANIEHDWYGAGSAGLTFPPQARYMDIKMDDGNPKSGDVQARSFGGGSGDSPCEDSYDFNDLLKEQAQCVMLFILQR